MRIRAQFKSDSGMTLVEMVIVMTILGLISAFALMALADSATHLDRQNLAREFKISLERARFDSVKRNVSRCEDMARVTIKNSTVFTLLTDQNRDGILSPDTETRTIDFSDPGNIVVVYDLDQGFPITIRFDRRGNTSSGDCDSQTAAKTPTVFCTMPCTFASATEKNSNVVYVSPTGTTAFITGAFSLPNLAPPVIANLDNSSQINPGLAVWDMASPLPSQTPSPTGSATPTSTPSPTPSATPSATPTPSPSETPMGTPTPVPSVTPIPTVSPATSPTPTATPRFCLLGEQPSIANCICSPLQYFQISTGKCRAL